MNIGYTFLSIPSHFKFLSQGQIMISIFSNNEMTFQQKKKPIFYPETLVKAKSFKSKRELSREPELHETIVQAWQHCLL